MSTVCQRPNDISINKECINMTSKTATNAKRLVNTLDRYSDEKRTIEILAHYLNYDPEQLIRDIADLKAVIKEFDKE